MTARQLALLGLKLVCFLAVIAAAVWVAGRVKDMLDMALSPEGKALMRGTIILAIVVYMIVLCVPFLPGAEIGLVLLTALGAEVAWIVYAATVTSLSISFAIGRLMPRELAARAFERVGLVKAARLLRAMERHPRDERLNVLLTRARSPWLQGLTKARYLLLAVLFNVPGNVLIGGGGGIALVAGMSRVFHPVFYVATVALAVLPVPLFVLFVGQ